MNSKTDRIGVMSGAVSTSPVARDARFWNFTRRTQMQTVRRDAAQVRGEAARLLALLLAFAGCKGSITGVREGDTTTRCLPGQTCYYVSAAGDDGHDGTSEATAWKTIAKVNSASYTAGNAILFRAGDEFPGQITVSQSSLTFGSYGGGPKPIINGAVTLTGWTVHSGSIYKTRAPALVMNLFAGGIQMALARHPNTGFLTVATTNRTDTITATTGLNQAPGAWIGANLIIRVVPFYYQDVPVTSFDGTSLVIGTSGRRYPITDTGLHFYLANALEALDAPGEWYCDPATYDVYLYAPNGVDPNTLKVEASIFDYGVRGTQSNTTIKGLAVRHQSQAAIRLSGTLSNTQILSNDIADARIGGIQITGAASNLTIDGNVIERVGSFGVDVGNGSTSTISNNTVRDIALVPGFGVDRVMMDSPKGIGVTGSGYTIRRNMVDGSGYIGIRAEGVSALVEENVVRNTLLNLADGGGIYAYGEGGLTHDGIWRNNIIDTVVGDTDGGNTPWTTANGIYLDYGCYNMTIEGNTIIKANSAAVFIQYNDKQIAIRNNLMYDCSSGAGGKFITLRQDTTLDHGGHEFTGNVLYPTNGAQRLFYVEQVNEAALAAFGTMDHNYYCNPYGNSANLFSTLVKNGSGWTSNNYTLVGWRSLFGQDASSKGMYATVPAGQRPERLFLNDTTAAVSFDLAGATYRDLDGNVVTGSITLAPFASRILILQ